MNPFIAGTSAFLMLVAAMPARSQVRRCTSRMAAIPDDRLQSAIDELKRSHPRLVFQADDPCLQSAGTIRELAWTLRRNHLKQVAGYEFVKIINGDWYFTVERFRLQSSEDLAALTAALEHCRPCRLRVEANTRLEHFSYGDSIVFMISSAVGGQENAALFDQIRKTFLWSPAPDGTPRR